MLRSIRQTPLESRVEAHRPISADLLAAVAGESTARAEQFAVAWFDTVATLTAVGRVIVFDNMVIGPPSPLALEAAHHVRMMRRAERDGGFDEEEARWYQEHEDDDAVYDPPRIATRVLDAMACQQEHDRLVTGDVVAVAAWRAFDTERELLVPVVKLGISMKRLVLELADAVRIGQGVVIDARLPGEWLDRLRWAA
jgi:hypothetical protein